MRKRTPLPFLGLRPPITFPNRNTTRSRVLVRLLFQIRKVASTGAGLQVVVQVGQGSRLSREWAGLMTFPGHFLLTRANRGRRNDGTMAGQVCDW